MDTRQESETRRILQNFTRLRWNRNPLIHFTQHGVVVKAFRGGPGNSPSRKGGGRLVGGGQ